MLRDGAEWTPRQVKDKWNVCKCDECYEEKKGLRQKTVAGSGASLTLAGQEEPL